MSATGPQEKASQPHRTIAAALRLLTYFRNVREGHHEPCKSMKPMGFVTSTSAPVGAEAVTSRLADLFTLLPSRLMFEQTRKLG